MFKRWSEIEVDAKNSMSPDLGLRSWNELSVTEKGRMFEFFKEWFKETEKEFYVFLQL